MAKAQNFKVVLILFALVISKRVLAQDRVNSPTEDRQNLDSAISVDDAPPHEAPYPGAADTEFSPAPAASPPTSVNAPSSTTTTSQEKEFDLPQSSDPQEKKRSRRSRYDAEGVDSTPYKKGFHLEPHPQAGKGLLRIEKDGTYVYQTNTSEQTGTMALKFGAMAAPRITAANGLTYKDMYGGGAIPVITADYEWIPLKSFGQMGLQVGSGLMTATGKGRFKNPSRTDFPEESFNLSIFPNHLDLIYKFQYSRKQYFVPYLTGGGMYFGLFEIRDDQTMPKVAGSSALTSAGGLLISLSRLDKMAGAILDREYGINNAWLTLEARYILGLKKSYDFTTTVLVGGLTLDF